MIHTYLSDLSFFHPLEEMIKLNYVLCRQRLVETNAFLTGRKNFCTNI